MRSIVQLAGPCLALLFVGCGGPKGPTLVPVTGTVKYKGQPLTEAMVSFSPLDDTIWQGSRGRTDSSGTYKLMYLRGGEGIPAGKYKVVVSKTDPPAPELNPKETPQNLVPGKELLPPRFVDPSFSRLIFTVPEKGGTIDIELK